MGIRGGPGWEAEEGRLESDINAWAILNYWGHVPELSPQSLRLCLWAYLRSFRIQITHNFTMTQIIKEVEKN